MTKAAKKKYPRVAELEKNFAKEAATNAALQLAAMEWLQRGR